MPYGPGGVADTTARLLAQKLNDRLRQPFIIENRPGAGGILASQAGATAPPDGYTLTLTGNGTAISKSLFKTCPTTCCATSPRSRSWPGSISRSRPSGWPAQDREGYRRGGEEKSRQAEFRHDRARQHTASVGGAVHADGRHQGHDGDVPHHARPGDSPSARRRRRRLRLSGRPPRPVEQPAASRRRLDRREAFTLDPDVPTVQESACRIMW